MKKILIFISILALYWACNSDDNKKETGYTIKGTIHNYDSIYIYLQKIENGSLINIDSVLCKNGQFKFQGEVLFPEMYYINFGDRQNYVPFFIENSEIEVNAKYDSLESIVIKGSEVNEEYNQYADEILPFNNKIKDLNKQFNEAENDENEQLKAHIDSTRTALESDKISFIKNYIANHKKSAIAPYILGRIAYTLNVESLDSMVSLLDSSLKPSVYYKSLKEKIQVLRSVDIGKVAPDFVLNDTSGNAVSLSSFKGKYLLLDFWASWCGDCRRENPNLVAIYADYKDKGLEILGVSFDKKKEQWINGIKNDGITWPQVSDLKGWNSEVGKLYSVSWIPHPVLLDKNGVIIAKNLYGNNLRKKIAEILD